MSAVDKVELLMRTKLVRDEEYEDFKEEFKKVMKNKSSGPSRDSILSLSKATRQRLLGHLAFNAI